MDIQTVFNVNFHDGSGRMENYKVEGYGQETVKTARKHFKKAVVILRGFMINDTFVKADLTSNTNLSKK